MPPRCLLSLAECRAFVPISCRFEWPENQDELCKDVEEICWIMSLAILLVTLSGWLSDPFTRLSDLQLGDKKAHFESPGLIMLISVDW